MFDISYPIALWAGLLSFFAPCVIPLFPAYIAYISGDSITEVKKQTAQSFKNRVIISSISYVLGFSLTFAVLGSSITGLGIVFRIHSDLVRIIGGSLIIFFGLELAQVFRIPFLANGGIKRVPEWTKKFGLLRPFLIGVVFASTWAPCVGPILGGILALSFAHSTAIQGAALLFTYSIGISIPFIIASLMLSRSQKYLNSISAKLEKVSKYSGYLMVLLGLLLITNKFGSVNTFLSDLF